MADFVFAFVILLSVLIFVHELGHFVAAKAFNIKATQAFFGFGPRIWSIQRFNIQRQVLVKHSQLNLSLIQRAQNENNITTLRNSQFLGAATGSP